MSMQTNPTSTSPATAATPRFSAVLETPAAPAEVAQRHFAGRLAFETDVSDLMADLGKGNPDLLVIDTRSPQSFELCHIPGALNLPRINAASTAGLPRDKVYVVYCWGPGCNGSTKGALRLAQLGFKVKELYGGLEYWRKEGGALEGQLGSRAPLYWTVGA